MVISICRAETKELGQFIINKIIHNFKAHEIQGQKLGPAGLEIVEKLL